MARRGPLTDATGTFYEVTDEQGRVRREYINTAPAATTTQISEDGSIIQPAALTGDQALVAQQAAGGAFQPAAVPSAGAALRAGGGDLAGRRPENAAPQALQLPNAAAYYGQGGPPQGPISGGPPIAAEGPAPLGAQIAGQVGGSVANLGGLGAGIAQAAGAQPRAADYQRPTISSDAGWAGPNSVGVFQGARVDNGQPKASGINYPSNHPLQKRMDPHPGGGTSDLYNKLRGKGQAMASKVRGMAESVGSGGGGYAPDPTTAGSSGHYRRQSRRIDKAYEKFNEQIYEPKPLDVHGILKRMGTNRYGAMGMLSKPGEILYHRRGLGLDKDTNSPFQTRLYEEPVTDIAMIMGGTQNRRGLTARNPTIRPPKILKKQGVDPYKPEQKRILDPSKVANEIAKIYRGQMAGGDLPSNEEMLGNLAHLKKKSALGQTLTNQYKEDPGGFADSVEQYMRTALFAGRPVDNVTLSQQRRLGMELAGSGIFSKRPKKVVQAVRRTARGLL